MKWYTFSMWLGTIAGIVLLIWTLALSMDYENRKNNGTQVQATIEQIDYVRYRRGHPQVYGTAVYNDKNGVSHSFNGYLGDYVDVGSRIELIYENDNPDSVVRKNDALAWLPWAGGGLMLFCGTLAVLLTFFSAGKHTVRCVKQTVPPDELRRIVNEYMPQTKQSFISGRSRNKRRDKLGCDTVLQRMIDGGDPVRDIYESFHDTLMTGDIRIGAVVGVSDRDIYSEMKDIGSEEIESGRARFTVPVFMICGEDAHFNAHPDELLEIAGRLSGNLYGQELSQRDAGFIEYLRDASSRPMGISYRSALTNDRTVLLYTVILSKLTLCNKKLCNKLLYLAVNGKYAAAIPARYYSLWELSAF